MIGKKIGFIGAGQMARALARGFVDAALVRPDNLLAADPVAAATDAFTSTIRGAGVTWGNAQLVVESDVVVLAVKPQHADEVLAPLKGKFTSDHLVISIVTGITLARLSSALGREIRLVRVMPNTPCLIGQGACGFALGAAATAEDGRLVKQLLDSVGIAVELDEKLLDAVTGLSGSGPAFVYLIIEALADAGVYVGLPRETALTLAVQTVSGSAEMVRTTGEHTAVLRDRVTSPGGTTIAGLAALEAGGVRSALIRAVEAATQRASQLGQ